MTSLSAMPLLDIATAQASLQIHLGPRRAYSGLNCRVLPCPFTVGDERRRGRSWESLQFPGKVHTHKKSRLVAALELKRLAGKEAAPTSCQGVLDNDDAGNGSVEVKSLWKELEELDAKERTRRMRISKAKRGLTPWNKGRKHSPETIQRIKERTRLAMQDPKVKTKLSNLGYAQSEETKLKIAESVRTGWQKRREKQLSQETCYHEWQNLIAEASRNGYAGKEELQWNSYQVLNERLHVEWLVNVELRKTQRLKCSEETKLKIAESLCKWWQKCREKQLNQETCYYEWQNLIAEASRNGYAGEEELQWNSYQILNARLDVEWVESVELRKTTRPKGSRRLPKSPGQR